MSTEDKETGEFQVFSKFSTAENAMEYYKKLNELKGKMPWREMEKAGWVSAGNRTLKNIAPLLGMSQGSEGSSLFRSKATTSDIKVPLWQGRVNSIALKIFSDGGVAPFYAENVDKDFMASLAKESVDPEAVKELPKILSSRGVILVYQQGLPGMKTDGLVYKLSTGNPVIALSFRYSRLDYFWFTLMHELAHVVLHYGLLDNPILDSIEDFSLDRIERQADRLAQQSFIPRSKWERFPPKYDQSEELLVKESNRLGIHPAIAAGMIRKEKNNYTMFSRIVNDLDVRKMVFGVK